MLIDSFLNFQLTGYSEPDGVVVLRGDLSMWWSWNHEELMVNGAQQNMLESKQMLPLEDCRVVQICLQQHAGTGNNH